MKVALLLSGLPRSVKEGYDGYWKHIIDNYNVDLYLHTWLSKPDGITNHEDSDDVLRVYSKHGPNYLYIQNPFPFTEYREGLSTPPNHNDNYSIDFDVYGNFRCFPMFYSWESTYKQIINSGKQYDCIIRSRYDIAGPPINLSKLDLNKINTSNFHWSHSKTHDDNVCITNQENSNKLFSNIFMDIVDYHRKVKYINSPEQNFTDFMIRNDLYKIATKSNEINFLLLRNSKL
jgi:hypothetical protein